MLQYAYALDTTVFPPPEHHRLGYTPEQYLTGWREIERAVDLGLARSIGCSNMTAKKLEALLRDARIKPGAPASHTCTRSLLLRKSH